MRSSRLGLLRAGLAWLVTVSTCLAQSVPPAGTATRPTDGVRHPELDKAWDKYDAIVAKSAEGIRAAISKQFDAATDSGDLDAAEKWQATLDAFKESGLIPVQRELRTAINDFVSDLQLAKEELIEAYSAVEIALTKDKNLAGARAIREEAGDLNKRKVEQKPKAQAPRNRIVAFDLSKPPTLKLFKGGGPAKPNAGGLEFPGGGVAAWADSTEGFRFPLKVTFVVGAFEDKNFDINPGIFSSPGATSFGETGVHLHWGCFENKKTLLYVFGKLLQIPHRPIVAGQLNNVVMAVDKDRRLTIQLNGLVIHQDVLPAHLVLQGSIRCGGGIGHVLYRSVTVETEAN